MRYQDDASEPPPRPRQTIPEIDDSVVISGWSIKMCPASEKQTGIAIRPVVQQLPAPA
jgi:hypothetical protein